jgi:hypothetical protein
MHSHGSQQSKNQSNKKFNKENCRLFHVQSAGSLRVSRKKKKKQWVLWVPKLKILNIKY